MRQRLVTVLAILSSLACPRAYASEPAQGLPPPPAPVASIRILSPSPSDVPWGPTLIQAAVTLREGGRILRVELFADGALIAADPLPPYEARWEAGEGLAPRVIRAVALLADGSRVEDLVTTRGFMLREHEVVEATPLERVELLVSVTNAEGEPVQGLDAAAFVVRDRGEEVAILRASRLSERVDLPLSVALLVDRSGSMRVHMEKVAQAAAEVLEAMRPVDQVRVAAFSDEMIVLQDFTRDPASLRASLSKEAAGGTRLFKAVEDTVRDMRDRPGRKVIVVITDGLDTDFTSPSAPVTVSMYRILREVAAAASRAGVTIVVILPGPSGRGYLAIQDLALQTGGWYGYSGDDFARTVRRIGERLLSAWVIEYDVERPGAPDRKRPVVVSLAEGLPAGWEIRAAMGAYAGLDLFAALAADLQEGTDVQRARAAREIGYFAGEESAQLLRKALEDPICEVRVEAAGAAGRLLAAEPGAAAAGSPGPSSLEKLKKALRKALDDACEEAAGAARAAMHLASGQAPSDSEETLNPPDAR